ncbi:MAG: methylated-DNA--[protein]-cysteine S-methyltransferase [Spongiibacteraceae bacterium]|jgi:methylated-DNA-[protein]-cysteine S-methyltransferase|nr:methylated-DNA--[protein]-cysteine S-methyltransferase [Spongiibacteraceae bacterium]
MSIHYKDIATPLGTVRIAATAQALTGCYFSGQKYFPVADDNWAASPQQPLLCAAESVLRNYFNSGRLDDVPPLAPAGTEFQREVWRVLLRIPAGRTWTYRQVAEALGRPRAVRAAAAAIGRNPLSILIPCHRVVGSTRALTGYAGGLDRKAALLKLEGAMDDL